MAADLTAALVVQWVTRAVSASRDAPAGAEPAVILAGADEQSTRHLGRLTAVCERYDVPLVRTFSRLTEESARHLDTRHTAFMRLATRPEALRAAEHIGLERRFVAGRFAHRQSVSRSRTRTTSESVTHTTGRTEGEATTHTTGTTTGQSYSEAEVPRHEQQVHVHVEDHRPQRAARRRATARASPARRVARERAAAAAAEPDARPGKRRRAAAAAGRTGGRGTALPASGGGGPAVRRQRRAAAGGRQGRQARSRHREDPDLVHRPARERREDQVLVDDRGDQPHHARRRGRGPTG